MKYVTTPIYYVNDVAHLGHAYTSIIADVMARFYRLRGDGCFFLTGTDEHGQKIEEAAKKKNKDVKAYCDEISGSFKQLWDDFELSYDRFLRTTDAEHEECIKLVFSQMLANGDIYKGEYEGPYCISCESFFTPNQLVNNHCPDCGKEVKTLKEESYFFRLSKYEKPLLKWYEEARPVVPYKRQAEVENFVKSGLRDLSVTRTSFKWGISLPKECNDDKHVIYVWLDALFNYISALGYGKSKNKMSELWPASMHIVGKDILRFHAVYWPAFLMSLNLALPKMIATHGWWVVNGEKMSKSKGNVIPPKKLSDRYGLDAFRYFLLREIQFGKDGDFNEASMKARINAELCNELGNLLNRVLGMAGKYSDYKIDASKINEYFTDEVSKLNEYLKEALTCLENMALNKYLELIFKGLSLANASISLYEPWVLIKTNPSKANALVAFCANVVFKAGILLSPILIKSSHLIEEAFNKSFDKESFKHFISDECFSDFSTKKVGIMFERIEDEPIKEVIIEQNPIKAKDDKNKVSIKDFAKLKIEVASVLNCHRVEGSDKLLCFILGLLEGKSIQVISGLAKYYEPSSLIGTQVCVITNLCEAKIFGHVSEGMILVAKDKDRLSLLSTKEQISTGSIIC